MGLSLLLRVTGSQHVLGRTSRTANNISSDSQDCYPQQQVLNLYRASTPASSTRLQASTWPRRNVPALYKLRHQCAPESVRRDPLITTFAIATGEKQAQPPGSFPGYTLLPRQPQHNPQNKSCRQVGRRQQSPRFIRSTTLPSSRLSLANCRRRRSFACLTARWHTPIIVVNTASFYRQTARSTSTAIVKDQEGRNRCYDQSINVYESTYMYSYPPMTSV